MVMVILLAALAGGTLTLAASLVALSVLAHVTALPVEMLHALEQESLVAATFRILPHSWGSKSVYVEIDEGACRCLLQVHSTR
jgi:hypothetical protein